MGKEEIAELKPFLSKPVKASRPTKRKPKDKPKRPLSAYNFFFKQEREKILAVAQADKKKTKVENDPESEDYISDEQLGKLKKDGGKISFEFMGKLIGQRWKNIDPDRLAKFSELAAEDTERYKKEMNEYNSRQEAKMRTEAHKAPPSYGRDAGKADRSGSGGAYADMNSMSSMNSAFGNAGMSSSGYPYNMDFSGWNNMSMGMYGAYGSYPGMGGGTGSSGMGSGGNGGGGGSSSDGMSRGMNSSQMQEASQQYGMGMYGMMGGGGGFQGGMMGYGGMGGYDQSQQQGMDPQSQGMFQGGGYSGSGWGQQ